MHGGEGRHTRIVGIQHGDAIGRQRLDHLALGQRNPLPRIEVLNVRGADVGDDADIRPRNIGQ